MDLTKGQTLRGIKMGTSNKAEVLYRDSLGTTLLFVKNAKFPHTQYQAVYPERAGIQHQPEELPFQIGALDTDGINGCTNELLISALIHRIETMNEINPTEFNHHALRGLRQALVMLEQRDKFRRQVGINNTTKTSLELSKEEQTAVTQTLNRLALSL